MPASQDPAPTTDEVAELRARVADLERFVSRLAHELSTPLTTARGFASILLDDDDLAPNVRDALERIERATATAEAMLRARSTEASAEGQRPRPLGVVLREVLDEHVPAGSGGHDLEGVLVFAEHEALRRLLELLVVVLAARGADPDGASGPDVDVRAVDGPTDAVTLRFTCSGPPLTPAELAVVEQARETGDATDAASPVSRLRAARALAAVMGGKLWIHDPTRSSDRMEMLVQLPRSVTGVAST